MGNSEFIYKLKQNPPNSSSNEEVRQELSDMKKTYISPIATEISVAAENMIAASLGIHNDKSVDTSNEGQLGGNRRGEWGNLWQ